MRTTASVAAVAASLLLGACGGGDASSSTTASGSTSSSGKAGTSPATTPSSKATGTKKPTTTTGPQSTRFTASPAAAIEGALASRDPATACREAVTQRYVLRGYGGNDACASAVLSGGAAKLVDVRSLRKGGPNSATAKVVPTGGPNDGETLTVSVVREGDAWKVDEVKSNAPVGP